MPVREEVRGPRRDQLLEDCGLAASFLPNDHVTSEFQDVKVGVVILKRLEKDIVVISVRPAEILDFV